MKTITWAVSVITNVTDDVAQQGLFIIPCLLGKQACVVSEWAGGMET